MSDEDYFAHLQPDEPCLSQSGAKVLLECAAEFYETHRKLGNPDGIEYGTASADMFRGTVMGMLLLGGADNIVPVDFKTYASKAAKAARDEVLHSGRIPVKAHKLAPLLKSAIAITENLRAEGIEFTGKNEVVVIWQRPTKYGTIWCRAKLDHVIAGVNGEASKVYDVKAPQSASRDSMERAARKFGYDMQCAAYREAWAAATGEDPRAIEYKLLGVEVESASNSVHVAEFDTDFQMVGEKRWERACNLFAKCLREDNWPGYGQSILEAGEWYAARNGV